MNTLKFELTVEETNMILAGLQELPAKICNPLTEKLRQQAQPQLETSTPVEVEVVE
jgi:hypothetical protein